MCKGGGECLRSNCILRYKEWIIYNLYFNPLCFSNCLYSCTDSWHVLCWHYLQQACRSFPTYCAMYELGQKTKSHCYLFYFYLLVNNYVINLTEMKGIRLLSFSLSLKVKSTFQILWWVTYRLLWPTVNEEIMLPAQRSTAFHFPNEFQNPIINVFNVSELKIISLAQPHPYPQRTAGGWRWATRLKPWIIQTTGSHSDIDFKRKTETKLEALTCVLFQKRD